MKRDLARLRARLIKLTTKVGADRDALRDIIDEAESLVETIDRAHDLMTEAADALSELA